jgi:hypothetical protein
VKLERAFSSSRFTRRLDALGCARFRRWRLYAEEGFARCEVAVWISNDDLVVEYAGQTLSSYDVSFSDDAKLREVTNPRLLLTRHRTQQQLKLFALEYELGEDGWLKVLRLEEYAVRSRRPEVLQQTPFPYPEAL